MNYSDLCRNIKQRMCWDKILFYPSPRAKVVHEGYRININTEKEEDIEQAKEILRKAHVVFEDKRSTSPSETVAPGDRTLRVFHQESVKNLRKMWAQEFENSRFAQTIREQNKR